MKDACDVHWPHVPQHPHSLQLLAADDRRRGRGRSAPIRAKGERDDEAVAGQRGGLRPRSGRRGGDHGAPARRARDLRTAPRPRGRGREAARPRRGALRHRRLTVVVYETHATSGHNEAGIATGWLGGGLSAAGRAQAAAPGRRRRDDGIELVVASDLNRAVETASIAFDGSGIPVLLDWRLRECDYGDWNGMPRARLDVERAARVDVPFPGGESWRQAVARVDGFLAELATDGAVVIGHIATRWAFEQRCRGRSLEELAAEEFLWQPGWEYSL